MICVMLYVVSLVLIKASICMTMLRVGRPLKTLRIFVYILLGFSIGTFLATTIGILLICKPVEANWNTGLVLEGKATCASLDAMIGLSYFSTASSIATDMACAVLPGLLVWNLQLKRTAKTCVCGLLSFGSLAFISTIIRTPYVRFYRNPASNLVYHIGNIVLWSNIETAIGLVAGSIPSLRRLFMRSVEKSDAGYSGSGMPGRAVANELVTFGGTSMGGRRTGNRSFKNPTDIGVSVSAVHTRADGDWKRLQDEHSDCENEKNRHIIRTHQTYEVETESAEHHSYGGSSRDSILKGTR